jgi:hypothetical protein
MSNFRYTHRKRVYLAGTGEDGKGTERQSDLLRVPEGDSTKGASLSAWTGKSPR